LATHFNIYWQVTFSEDPEMCRPQAAGACRQDQRGQAAGQSEIGVQVIPGDGGGPARNR
jgi:hypothetical protein